MKAVKQLLITAAVAAAGVLPLGVQAQSHSPSHSGSHSSASEAATEMTEGEVRKVDKDNKKITLKHGAIKNLDMPPMTMVFTVNDASMLEKVQTGDKVRFKASGEGGKFTVTDLQPAQ